MLLVLIVVAGYCSFSSNFNSMETPFDLWDTAFFFDQLSFFLSLQAFHTGQVMNSNEQWNHQSWGSPIRRILWGTWMLEISMTRHKNYRWVSVDVLPLLGINCNEEKSKLTEGGWKNYSFELGKKGMCYTSPFSLFSKENSNQGIQFKFWNLSLL